MEVPLHWRLKAQRYRLEGSICSTCGRPTFPPRPVCPSCLEKTGRMTDSEFPAVPLSDRKVDIHLLKG
jgi:uncharacterized OB-fold protein